MTIERSKSNNFTSTSTLFFNGALAGLFAPVTITVFLVKTQYLPMCLGFATIGTIGFGVHYAIENDSKVLDNMKQGGSAGSLLGLALSSVSIIIEYPVIVPISIATMVGGGILGLIVEKDNYQHINQVDQVNQEQQVNPKVICLGENFHVENFLGQD